jgi:N-acyl-D-aspartate/D-glutamate deacylase
MSVSGKSLSRTCRSSDRGIGVIDPAGLDGSSSRYAEAPYPGAESVKRMVNRNDRAVTATVVGGHIVYVDGVFSSGFGSTLRAGTFLRSTQPVRALAAQATRP